MLPAFLEKPRILFLSDGEKGHSRHNLFYNWLNCTDFSSLTSSAWNLTQVILLVIHR